MSASPPLLPSSTKWSERHSLPLTLRREIPSGCNAIRNRGLPSGNRLGQRISRHGRPYQFHFPLRTHTKLRHASRHDDRITLAEGNWLSARGFATSATFYCDDNVYRAFANVITPERAM